MPQKKFEPIARIGKVHRVGNSLMITLPSEFVDAHGIKEGDKVGILADHILKLDPMKEGHFEEEGDNTSVNPKEIEEVSSET